MNNYIQLEAFVVHQPMHSFYVAKIKHNDLIKMSSKDINSLIQDDGNNIYQRKLDKNRIPSLKKYMAYSRAIFPSGIILNACNNSIVSFENGVLTIEKKANAFFIIDGQHRIEALKYYNKQDDFELCVVIFNQISLDDQTEIFATVNGEQKAVNPSVRMNLKGNDEVDTPDKVIRDVVILLNEDENSPFFKMIKTTDLDKGSISMSAVASPILAYIYDKNDYYEIKDLLLRNKNDRKCLIEKYHYDLQKKVLWDIYSKGFDSVIYKMLNSYFLEIKEIYSQTKKKDDNGNEIVINQWGNPDYILTKTTGYNALILLLKDLINYKCNKNFKKDNFHEILMPLRENKVLITQDLFGSGLAASHKLYEFLYKLVFKNDDYLSFNVNEFEDFVVDD